MQLALKKGAHGWVWKKTGGVLSAVVAKNSSRAPQHKAQALSFRFTRFSVIVGNGTTPLTVTGVMGFSISPHSHLHIMTYASLQSKAVMSNTCLNRSFMWRIWVQLVAVGITAEKHRSQWQLEGHSLTFIEIHIFAFSTGEMRILVATIIFTQVLSPTVLYKLSFI